MDKKIENQINLIGSYKKKKIDKSYKSEYNRLFPTRMSSSSFLTVYTLFVLKHSSRPMYGKEILLSMKEILGESQAIWKPSHGTLYPLLEQLVDQGYIKITESTRSKNYYTITDAGEELLKEKMLEFKTVLLTTKKFFDTLFDVMYK